MTPPENPAKGRDAEKTAVITKPTPPKAAQKKSGEPAEASGGDGSEQVTKPVTPPAAETKAEAETKPEVKAPEAAKAPEAKPEEPKADEKTVTVEEPDPAVTAPPPWQRVANDTAYEAPATPVSQIPPVSGVMPAPVEQPVEQVSYPANDPDTVSVARPTPPGIAVPLGLGNRTSVNLGTNGRPSAAAPSARRPGRGPRRASLQIKRVDPWSVLKLALVLGVALFFVWLVAVGVLYGVLHGMGVWDKINSTANDLLQSSEPTGEVLISAGRVFGVSAIIGAVNIVLFTALATVGAFVYNVSADLAGGLELTLSERE